MYKILFHKNDIKENVTFKKLRDFVTKYMFFILYNFVGRCSKILRCYITSYNFFLKIMQSFRHHKSET